MSLEPSSGRWMALILILVLACAPPQPSREQWLSMKPEEKRLYVSMLLGHEKVVDRKGGNPRKYSRSPEEYVRRIDERYAAGDRRAVNQIWDDLADAH